MRGRVELRMMVVRENSKLEKDGSAREESERKRTRTGRGRSAFFPKLVLHFRIG